MTDERDPVVQARAAVESAWDVVRESVYVSMATGSPLRQLPDVSESAVVERGVRARLCLHALASFDVALLPHELALTVQVARDAMTVTSRVGDWYWLVFDPLGIGFFGMFAPTAYCGGLLLDKLLGAFATCDLRDTIGLTTYLSLVEDLGRLLRQLDARTRGQADRGIHMPTAQLEQAVTLVSAQRASIEARLVPSNDRLGDERQRALVEWRVHDVVLPALDDTLAWLSHPDRAAEAGYAVGLAAQPGGADVYAELVRLHTTLDLEPGQVHEQGLARLSEISAGMEDLLDQMGVAHSAREHMTVLADDPAWRATTPEEISRFFGRYINRLRPRLEQAFRTQPPEPYGVAPLPEALEASMTFGYYDLPTGRYLFNAANLSAQALATVAAVNYHELVPGHHFHMASQRDDETLHPLRRHSFFNAYNEGWAEYAAHVAGELGMYEDPNERFGKLVMEAFLVTRLVVDTGMNALGWTLEQARDFMREHAFIPEAEVVSESIRYSCDLPGQALGYKIGDLHLQGLRRDMAAALGERFDVRDFHDLVLRPGSLPLWLVEDNVRRGTEALLAQEPGA